MRINRVTKISSEVENIEAAVFFQAGASVLFCPRQVVREKGDFGRAVYGDLFLPKMYQEKSKKPAIVFLHGGSWRFGSPSQFYFQSKALAEQLGIISLNLDYRLSEEACFPAPLHDVHSAVRWLRTNQERFGIDPEKIAICGGSSGAHLAALTMLSGTAMSDTISARPNAAIFLNGEYNILKLIEEDRLTDAIEALVGERYEVSPEKFKEISPFHKAASRTPPTLLLHGGGDECSPCSQSIEYAEVLSELGTYTELEIYSGKPHGWFNKEPDRSITLNRIVDFLKRVFELEDHN